MIAVKDIHPDTEHDMIMVPEELLIGGIKQSTCYETIHQINFLFLQYAFV